MSTIRYLKAFLTNSRRILIPRHKKLVTRMRQMARSRGANLMVGFYFIAAKSGGCRIRGLDVFSTF